ncbi:MAG: hypothetical protein KAI73_05220 [Rhodospirillaceae bacterium]|nr:hypothetical protein [Rhodospirillaceae bacterium]
MSGRHIFYVGADPERYKTEIAAIRECFASLDKSKRWKVVLEPYVKRRSKGQDGLVRIWDGKIADFTGDDQASVHDYLVKKFCPVKHVTIAGDEVEVQSTKYLNTQEMSDYMTRMEAWAATTLHFTLPPAENK